MGFGWGGERNLGWMQIHIFLVLSIGFSILLKTKNSERNYGEILIEKKHHYLAHKC